MSEQIANLAKTTLSSGINNSATSIVVASAALFPSQATYRIVIDSEIMLVTGGAGTTSWVVTRGAEGTTAASHTLGAPVTHVLTRAGLLQVIADLLPPVNPAPNVAGSRTLGTGANEAAAGNDPRFPDITNPLTIKCSYLGTPGGNTGAVGANGIFFQSMDLGGNIITPRDTVGVVESSVVPGLYTFDQVISLDQFIAMWDEGDPTAPAIEVIATRHVATLPAAPTIGIATGGDQSATIPFTPGDNGGSAILSYTATATDHTGAFGGQTATGTSSPLFVDGLHNGDSYTFTVHAHTIIGNSAESAASNAVVPSPVVTVPGAPTNVVAAVTGSGTVTITFTAPSSDGGAAITSYLVSAIDETNGAHNATHAGNSPNVFSGLVNGEFYHFTVHAVNSAGAGAESVASGTVKPTGGGVGIASFSYSQPGPGSIVLLDSTPNSVGTLVWEIDGVVALGTGPTLLIGPMTVGRHHVKLTATSGGAAITEQDIDVAYVFSPIFQGQKDGANGILNNSSGVPTVGANKGRWDDNPIVNSDGTITLRNSCEDLPKFTQYYHPLGPMRALDTINMVDGFPTHGDNSSRIVILDNNHVRLITKFADWPGGSGGYRSAFEVNSSFGFDKWSSTTTYAIGAMIQVITSGGSANNSVLYTSLQNANLNNPPATSPSSWQLTHEFVAKSAILMDINGNGTSVSNTTPPHPLGNGPVRFMRISFFLPSSNPNPFLYVNNFFEMHGAIDGAGVLIFDCDGSGTHTRWLLQPKVNGNDTTPLAFDTHNVAYDTWFDYIIEYLFSPDPTVGYIRVYRDFGLGAGMQVIPLALCPSGTVNAPGVDYGKKFWNTTQTDKQTGARVYENPTFQNYLDKTGAIPPYVASGGTVKPADHILEYRNIVIGPTFDSVTRVFR